MSSPRQYRGIRVDNGEWVYGYYAETENNNSVIIPLKYKQAYSASLGTSRFTRKLTPQTYGIHEVIPETVGQEIGLRDKNGVDVYGGHNTNHGKVRWSKREYAWQVGDSLLYEVASDIEVLENEP